jgi:hypothetical protein
MRIKFVRASLCDRAHHPARFPSRTFVNPERMLSKEGDMRTKNIPSDKWRRELDELSRTHDGAMISMEVLGGEIGAQREVQDQPLRGISSDRRGVAIRLEKRGGIHLEHLIAHPTALRIVETDEGAVMALEVEDEGGNFTLVSFRSPARRDINERFVE